MSKMQENYLEEPDTSEIAELVKTKVELVKNFSFFLFLFFFFFFCCICSFFLSPIYFILFNITEVYIALENEDTYKKEKENKYS